MQRFIPKNVGLGTYHSLLMKVIDEVAFKEYTGKPYLVTQDIKGKSEYSLIDCFFFYTVRFIADHWNTNYSWYLERISKLELSEEEKTTLCNIVTTSQPGK